MSQVLNVFKQEALGGLNGTFTLRVSICTDLCRMTQLSTSEKRVQRGVRVTKRYDITLLFAK